MNHNHRPADPYNLLRDPLYYAVVILFAFLATALPALLRASWLLLLAQTISLWLLLLVPLRRNSARYALVVVACWVAVQFVAMFAISLGAPNRAEVAIGNGFQLTSGLLAWLYTGSPLPLSWFSQPLQHLVAILGATLGALVSGGLLGVWFLMRAVNVYAFSAAVLVNSAGGAIAALQPWALLQIAGYVGLLPLLALPGFNGEWNPAKWSPRRRKLLLIAGALLLAGLVLELFLPGLWARWFGTIPGL